MESLKGYIKKYYISAFAQNFIKFFHDEQKRIDYDDQISSLCFAL